MNQPEENKNPTASSNVGQNPGPRQPQAPYQEHTQSFHKMPDPSQKQKQNLDGSQDIVSSGTADHASENLRQGESQPERDTTTLNADGSSPEGMRADSEFSQDEKAFRGANRAASDIAHNTHPGHPGEHATREETGRHAPRTP